MTIAADPKKNRAPRRATPGSAGSQPRSSLPPLSALPDPWPALVDEFTSYLTVNLGLSPATITRYRRRILHHLRWEITIPRDPTTSTPTDIERYVREIFFGGVRSPSARSGALSALKRWYRWLRRTGRVDADPTTSLTSPKAAKRQPRPLSPDELKRILAAPRQTSLMGRRDLALMLTLLAAGPRVAEICALSVADVTISSTGAALRFFGKGAKERTVKVRYRTAKRLIEFIAGQAPEDPVFRSMVPGKAPRRLTPSSVEVILKRHAEKAGFSKGAIHAHRFRSTFATRLHEEGHEAEEISVKMGHAFIDTTMAYIAVSRRTLDKTVMSDRFLASVEPPLPEIPDE